MLAYLDALSEALSLDGDSAHGIEARAWARVAREHALTRVREGFNVDEIVHELAMFRQVLLEIAREEKVTLGRQVEAIERVIDVPIEAAVHSYVDARDYQTRRSEAEHISFLTHELRNPLATATLAAAQLTEMGLPTPSHQRALELIQRSLARLRRLLESGLEAELLQMANLQAQPLLVRLGTVMEEALAGARPLAADRGVELDVDFDGSMRVWLDPLLTASALGSLFDNAIRFSDGGRLRVRVADTPEALVFDVWDSAERLTAEELRVLFEPARKRARPAGIGFLAARRAIEAQGGSIQARAGQAETGDDGCYFRITLPKARH